MDNLSNSRLPQSTVESRRQGKAEVKTSQLSTTAPVGGGYQLPSTGPEEPLQPMGTCQSWGWREEAKPKVLLAPDSEQTRRPPHWSWLDALLTSHKDRQYVIEILVSSLISLTSF